MLLGYYMVQWVGDNIDALYLDMVPIKWISWSYGMWEAVFRFDIISIDCLWYRALFSSHNGFDVSVTPFYHVISSKCIGALELQVYTLVILKTS